MLNTHGHMGTGEEPKMFYFEEGGRKRVEDIGSKEMSKNLCFYCNFIDNVRQFFLEYR